MFSKEFMRYLINYQPDGYEYSEKDNKAIKEIYFKQKKNSPLAKVFLTVDKK